MKTWMAAALSALAGCATTVQPRAQYFTGDPYDVVAKRGVIAGDVCGVVVNYAVSRRGNTTVLLGAGMRRLEIRDEGGARHLIDAVGRSVAAEPWLDVWISADRIAGHVGARSFVLDADGEVYRGAYMMPGTSSEARGSMEVAGRSTILQMPRAELAAIAPGLLSCERRGWTPPMPTTVEDPIAVRFGGPVHYETTSAR